MKTLLAIIFLGIIHSACGQKAGQAVLKGRIDNYNNSKLSINDSLLSVSEKGEFEYSVNLAVPAEISVQLNNTGFNLYLLPGEKLEFQFDEAFPFDNYKFTGEAENINSLLLNVTKISNETGQYFNNNWYMTYSKNEQEFWQIIESKRKLYIAPIDMYLVKNTIGADYIKNIRTNINFSFDKLIMYYPFQHLNFTNEEVMFSESMLNYLNSLEIDNPAYLTMNQYNEFCSQYLYFKIFNEFEKVRHSLISDHIWLEVVLKVVPATFKNPEVLDYWLYKEIVGYIDNNGIKNIEPDLEKYRILSGSKFYEDKIDSIYKLELENRKNHLIETYKTINGFGLDAHIFIPEDIKKDEVRPAMIYFHGGEWSAGKPDYQFGYSELGFINICIEYRTINRYGVIIPEEVSDVKSAIRWIRENAEHLHIDKDKIIASGNSSGAHLSVCAALLDTLDEPGENLKISSKPNALVLNSAGYNSQLYFNEDEQKIYGFLSPLNNIKEHAPPMLIFHGKNDFSTPYEYAEIFANKMKELGNNIAFYPIEGCGHELWFNGTYWETATKAKKEFFKGLGYY